MARKKAASLTIRKLDAARRQLETAITLWFEDGDSVAIHTLTAAGHQVCHGLIKAVGGKSPFLFDMDRIRPEYHSLYKKLMLKAENFFKHANTDPYPDAAIEFIPEVTEVYLLDAVELFLNLNGTCTPLMMAFRFWFIVSHPELVASEALPELDEAVAIEFRSIPKKMFLDVFLQYLPRLQRKLSL